MLHFSAFLILCSKSFVCVRVISPLFLDLQILVLGKLFDVWQRRSYAFFFSSILSSWVILVPIKIPDLYHLYTAHAGILFAPLGKLSKFLQPVLYPMNLIPVKCLFGPLVGSLFLWRRIPAENWILGGKTGKIVLFVCLFWPFPCPALVRFLYQRLFLLSPVVIGLGRSQ